MVKSLLQKSKLLQFLAVDLVLEEEAESIDNFNWARLEAITYSFFLKQRGKYLRSLEIRDAARLGDFLAGYGSDGDGPFSIRRLI